MITPEEFGADRETVRLALEAENIEARPVWPPAPLPAPLPALRAGGLRLGEKPMHLQPVFNPQITQITPINGRKNAQNTQEKKRYKARVVGGEVAEDLFRRGLCLPSGTAMTEEDIVIR